MTEQQTIRNQPRRTPIVSDRSNPTPSITTQVPRPIYEAFESLADKAGLSKAAYLRVLITKHVEGETR